MNASLFSAYATALSHCTCPRPTLPVVALFAFKPFLPSDSTLNKLRCPIIGPIGTLHALSCFLVTCPARLVVLLLAFLALPTAFPVYRSLEPEKVVPFSEL